MAWRSIICTTFVVLVCTNFGSPAYGEDNAFTVLFGSEATLQNLLHEVGNIKQGTAVSRQSLMGIKETQQTLLSHFYNLQSELRRQNDYMLQSVKALIVDQLKAHEIQRQLSDRQAQEVALSSQQTLLKEEINKFEIKFLATLRNEFDSQRTTLQQKLQEKVETQTEETKEMFKLTTNNLIDTVKDFIKPLKSEILTELKKSEPNAQRVAESTILKDDPPDTWPSYKTFLKKPNVRLKGNHSTDLCDDAFISGLNVASSGINAWKIFENNSTTPFYCLKDPGGGKAWRVIQRRHIDDNLTFDRSWLAYKKGFGNEDRDFFIGLDAIHRMMLPNKSTELWIQLGTEDGHSPFEMYKNFVVSSEENGFQLIFVYGANGTADDEFTPVIGEPFQTWDALRRDLKLCAQRMHSGWWYPTDGDLCGSGNLNRNFEDMTWGDWNNIVYTHMAIRHNDNLVKVEHRVFDLDEDMIGN